MRPLDQVMSLLPLLSASERRLVRQQCMEDEARTEALEPEALDFYALVCDVLRERGFGTMIPPGEGRHARPRSPHFDRTLFDAAFRWFESVCRESGVHGTPKRRLARVIVSATLDWIDSGRHISRLCEMICEQGDERCCLLARRIESIAGHRAGVSLKSVLRALAEDGDAILEQAFPGYRSAGLIKLLAKRGT